MASETGQPAHTLTERLAEAPWSFDFFQLVRRLDCAHAELPPVGHSVTPAEDPVRFGQNPETMFAPSTVAGYRAGEEDGPAPRLFVNFMGLLGPNGPLPLHLTEYARDRERNHGDRTLARFLDVFNHRMVSFFYRAWACNQQVVNYERDSDDRFAFYIGSLFGIAPEAFCDRDAVPDVAKLHYSGRLVCQTKHPEGLAAVLGDYFGVGADVEEFVGRWVELPSDYHCRLGESPETGAVGLTAIVGARIWDCQQKFRIRLGPMGLADYERMLPTGESYRRLVDWTRNYVGDELCWDVQLVLRAEEVPETRLGAAGRLGWTTWLRSRPFEKDADDLVLSGAA